MNLYITLLLILGSVNLSAEESVIRLKFEKPLTMSISENLVSVPRNHTTCSGNTCESASADGVASPKTKVTEFSLISSQRCSEFGISEKCIWLEGVATIVTTNDTSHKFMRCIIPESIFLKGANLKNLDLFVVAVNHGFISNVNCGTFWNPANHLTTFFPPVSSSVKIE